MNTFDYPTQFRSDEAFARELDAVDPLRHYREQFHLPPGPDGTPAIYLCCHSLGLQPRAAAARVQEVLASWAKQGVHGHFHGDHPWYTYLDPFRAPLARLVGARPGEVTLMNGLTVNLHLLMASFYRPQPGRSKVLIEEPAFPSDLYAVQSQLRHHGLDPADALRMLRPRPGEHLLRQEDIASTLRTHGREIALVLLGGVNFFTGQCLDMAGITTAARQQGCVVGFDLAHAVGNVALELHAWDVDFAVWCSYKYLCGGPGAVAGCFVHERHGSNRGLERLAGWWGNDPATRFRMQLQPEFIPQEGAGGWQVSNPPILALAPLRAALELFDEAGLPRLLARSRCLTSYLLSLLEALPRTRLEVLTPRNAPERGAQVSLLVRDRPRELFAALEAAGVIGDFREPNVIRVAPAPLLNTFHEVWRFARLLAAHTG